MILSSIDSELPSCFKAICHNCGWKGKFQKSYLYYRGSSSFIGEYSELKECPSCKKEYKLQRKTDWDSFQQRFKWNLNQVLGFEKGEGFYPCSCNPQPSMRQIGEIVINPTRMGGCFDHDQGWVRVSSKIKCNGCYAEGILAILEHHRERDSWWNWYGNGEQKREDYFAFVKSIQRE